MKIKDLLVEEEFITDPDKIFAWLRDNMTADNGTRSMFTIKEDMVSISKDGVVDFNLGIGFKNNLKLKKLPVKFGKVHRLFDSNNLGLTSFDGFPTKIIQVTSADGYLSASSNYFTSLKGITRSVSEIILTDCNKITTLKDVHLHIDDCEGIFLPGSITSCLLGVMKIKNMKYIRVKEPLASNPGLRKACEIINKYLKENRVNKSDILSAQQELIDADFEDFAEL